MTQRTKTMAFLSGGLVLGLGITATLAAWTDTEWVFGGNADGSGPGVGTGTFEVEQNVSVPFDPAAFGQFETNPGQDLAFAPGALTLSPGTSVYAPVALRTIDGSVGAALTLQDAVPAEGAGLEAEDPDGLLLAALTLRVAVSATATTCDAAAFTTGTIIASGSLDAAQGTAAQALAADSGSTQYYCFEVTLPAAPVLPAGATVDVLQGRAVTPAWEFIGTSV